VASGTLPPLTIEVTLDAAELEALRGAPGAPGAKGDKGDPAPPVDLSGYYTREEIDQKFRDYTGVADAAHGLWLDDFDGADDDAKLDKALAASQAGTVRRPILLGNRDDYDFTKSRAAMSGIRLIQPYGIGTQERGAKSSVCNVNFNGTGNWWTLGEAKVFDFQLDGFSATATKTNPAAGVKPVLLAGSGSNVLWTSGIGNISTLNWYGVLGSKEQKLLNTACSFFYATSNVQNARGMQIHVGGSDSTFFAGKTLIDAGSRLYSGDDYLMWFDGQQKSHAMLFYMTAENLRGVKNSGNITDGPMYYHGFELEGRNAGAPSRLPFHLVSGDVVMSDGWIGFDDTGAAIVQDGGRLFLDGVKFGLASGVSSALPVLVQNAGYAELSRGMGNWAGNVYYRGASVDARGLWRAAP
jgi:hypothetical protein